jgi:hypothetical protein
MKPGKLLFCLFTCLLVASKLPAQLPNGAWRDHLPYRQARRLAEAGDKIFCATSGGGLFYYNRTDNSIGKMSKVNGLSDADISTIAFSKEMLTLVIGYSNGNIDLVRNDSIYNINDIKRKTFTGDKSIRNIWFLNNYAYLACGFGIVVCDLERREIKDTYLIGEGGTQIGINDIAFDGQNLYAATDLGIYKANINSPNLADYNSWIKMLTLPSTESKYRFLAFYNNRLYTVYRNQGTGFDEIIEISDHDWQVWAHSFDDYLDYLGAQDGYLVICAVMKTLIYDRQENLLRDVLTYFARHALYDSQKVLWYAEPDDGLIRVSESGGGTLIVPEGPAYRDAGDMEMQLGELWVGAGTEATKWTGFGAYSFIDEKWTSYNRFNIPELSDVLNISEIAIDPRDTRHVIGGSYGYGLVEFQDGELTGIFDETDGILQPVPGYGHGYVLVTGVDFDNEGNLWIVTSFSNQPVYERNVLGEWETVQLNYKGFGVETRMGEIMVSSTDQKWLLLQNDGIVVFRKNPDGSEQEIFFTVRNQIPDLLDRVYSIAEDKDGDIWIGTNKGPIIYYNPESLFEDDNITGYQPEIPRNDGTNFVDLLLSTEKINDIAVDGANQKWVATEKSGVFLVSPDGKKEIHHFTEENSPLFSNNVQTLAVNDKTGEVFFGTDKGIVSFKGRATEGAEDFGNVYVYPNPVRENYTGDITITGLVANVDVKITDISGNLVYETKALGGQAIWDGRDFHGNRVHTGVYLVFCTNRDGTKTHVTKLLFIH